MENKKEIDYFIEKKIEEVSCKNCYDLFFRLKRKNTSGKGIIYTKIRPVNSVTCSPNCSREYSYKNRSLPKSIKRRKNIK